MRNRGVLCALVGLCFAVAVLPIHAHPDATYRVIADISVEEDTPEVIIDLPESSPEFLILRGVTSPTVGISDDLQIRFNSDAGPNYTWHYFTFFGDSNVCVEACNTSKAAGTEFNRGILALDIGNSTQDFAYFAAEIVNLPGINKKVMSRSNGFRSLGNAGFIINSTWNDPSLINSITLFFFNGDIRAGSRFLLFGLADDDDDDDAEDD